MVDHHKQPPGQHRQGGVAPPSDPAGLGQPPQSIGQQQAPKGIDPKNQQTMQGQGSKKGRKGIKKLADGRLAGDEIAMQQLAPQQASPAIEQPIEVFWIAARKIRQPDGPHR